LAKTPAPPVLTIEKPVVGKTVLRRFLSGSNDPEYALVTAMSERGSTWSTYITSDHGNDFVGSGSAIRDIYSWHPAHWDYDLVSRKLTPCDLPADEPIETVDVDKAQLAALGAVAAPAPVPVDERALTDRIVNDLLVTFAPDFENTVSAYVTKVEARESQRNAELVARVEAAEAKLAAAEAAYEAGLSRLTARLDEIEQALQTASDDAKGRLAPGVRPRKAG
jgi:hypothetical protein